jgi:crossover junction endodeoxyribonuclease RusA
MATQPGQEPVAASLKILVKIDLTGVRDGLHSLAEAQEACRNMRAAAGARPALGAAEHTDNGVFAFSAWEDGSVTVQTFGESQTVSICISAPPFDPSGAKLIAMNSYGAEHIDSEEIWTGGRRRQLRVPFPPTTNLHYRSIVRGMKAVVLVSKEGREYTRSVGRALAGEFWRVGQEARLSVAVDLYPTITNPFDVDNRLKPLLDSITQAGIWPDDSQIDDLRVRRRARLTGGDQFATVSVRQIGVKAIKPKKAKP